MSEVTDLWIMFEYSLIEVIYDSPYVMKYSVSFRDVSPLLRYIVYGSLELREFRL